MLSQSFSGKHCPNWVGGIFFLKELSLSKESWVSAQPWIGFTNTNDNKKSPVGRNWNYKGSRCLVFSSWPLFLPTPTKMAQKQEESLFPVFPLKSHLGGLTPLSKCLCRVCLPGQHGAAEFLLITALPHCPPGAQNFAV